MGNVWFILSVLANFIIIYSFYKKDYNVLLLFPLFAFSGRWLTSLTHIPNSVFFSYSEIIISLIIYKNYKKRDPNTKLLFIFSCLSLLPIMNIKDIQGLSTHLFYVFLLYSGIGYYTLFKEKMDNILQNDFFDKIALIWTILGLLYKILSAYEVNTWFLLSRAGSSLWASNHQAMIILLFLPFIKRKWIAIISVLFIMLHFSRGVYISLLLYLFLYFIFISPVKAIKIIRYSSIIIILAFLIFKYQFNEVYSFAEDALYSRIVSGGTNIDAPVTASNYTLSFNDIAEGFGNDDRNNIFNDALEISERTNYLGIGLGRFIDGLSLIVSPRKYSNAHNLYMTLLSEGGIIFLLFFICLMIVFLKKANRLDTKVFISLIIFVFYGFFSGQIYESSGERSVTDYFYLIFLFAYLNYKDELNKNILKYKSLS